MNAATFDQLFLRERRDLVHYALRLCRSLDHAEDLVQEAAIRAWQWLTRHELEGPFRPWMFVVVKRVFLTWRGKFVRLAEVSLDEALEVDEDERAIKIEFLDAGPTPEEQVLGAVLPEELEVAIEALPTELYQRTVRAVYLYDAEVTPVINQRLWKARKLMRAFLGVTEVGCHSERYGKKGLTRGKASAPARA